MFVWFLDIAKTNVKPVTKLIIVNQQGLIVVYMLKVSRDWQKEANSDYTSHLTETLWPQRFRPAKLAIVSRKFAR